MRLCAINKSTNFGCADCRTQNQAKRQTFNFKDEGAQRFIDDVIKAGSDVHPATIVLGAWAGYAGWKKGSKVVGWTRSAIGKAGEEIAKGTVRLASKVSKKVNPELAQKSVHKKFAKLIGTSEINSPKIEQRVKDVIDAIFSKEVMQNGEKIVIKKGDKAVEALNNAGVYLNGKSLFDNGIALLVGYGSTNLVSDLTEGTIDNKQVEGSALKNLGVVNKMLDVLIGNE